MEKTFTQEEVSQNNKELTAGLMMIGAALVIANKLGKRKGRKETLRLRKEFEDGVESYKKYLEEDSKGV